MAYKTIPREKKIPENIVTPAQLRDWTSKKITDGKLNAEQMARVASLITRMIEDKKDDWTSSEITTAIGYIRFLLSKMQLLQTKKLVALARELFNPGSSDHTTNILTHVRPKRRTRNLRAQK